MLRQRQIQHGRRNQEIERVSLIDLQEDAIARNSYMDKLVESWVKSKPGARLDVLYSKNKRRARHTALALEMQDRYLKKNLNETQIKTNFQTVPENVLRIIRIGVANSNRGDIFTEWPLITPDDAIFFVDKTYGNTKRGGVLGQRIYEGMTPNYATEIDRATVGTGDGSDTTFSATVTPAPVVPFSVRIFEGGKLIGNDDGAGNIVGSNLTTGSTVNYVSGLVSLVMTVAPATGVLVEVEFNWDSEVADNYDEYGEVAITVTKKRFRARPMPLGYSYTKMVELQLSTTGLGSVEDMLVKAVGDEHAMRRDYKAFQLAKAVAMNNAAVTFSADFATAQEDNDYNHAQRIITKIDLASGEIFSDIKRGRINKIVGSPKFVSYLKKHKLWVSDTSQPRVGGSYLAGKLDDIDVYTCPAHASLLAETSTSGQGLLVYKNPDEDGDISVAFGVLTELVAALDFPQFYRVGNVATVEDNMVINPKFVRLMNITDISD